MSIIKTMQREQNLLRLAVLIFSGGVMNSIMLLLTITKEMQELQINSFSGKQQIPFITTSPELTIVYLGFGIIYSLATSLSFVPRRIVSPFYTQIVTASILLTILYTYSFAGHVVNIDTNLIFGIIIAVFAFYGLLAIVGMFQGYILRRILGVNGNRENMDVQTYSVNTEYQNVVKIITDRKFLRDNMFFINKTYADRLVLQNRSSATEKHVLVIIPDHEEKNKTILAITSYLIQYDWLQKPVTVYDRETILGGIQRMLEIETKSKIEIKSHKEDQVATNTAINLTLKHTTSPFGNIKNLPKRRTIAFSAIVIFTVIISVIHFNNKNTITDDEFVNALIFIVISAIATILPLMKEKNENISNNTLLG